MGHITIPQIVTLYEYIKKHLIAFEDDISANIVIQKAIRVFINGAWVGITEDPLTLYNDMKDKKYKGIIYLHQSYLITSILKSVYTTMVVA